jgi:nicotinamidase-related amidase
MFDFAGESEEPNFIEGTSEIEYDDRLYRPSGCLDLTKTRYSAFHGTGLQEVLGSAGISTLVVCGFMTNYCCEGTAREAHDRDYFVDFIMDATGCPDASDDVTQDAIKNIVGASLEGGIARVHASREFLS